ncbi:MULTISPECIES: NAD(P)-dependent oxidoreductase [unclassified Pseudonocardia]|jgi:3-hydroxyisobutyrate dehydrogenase|uniref:NAD(P)-dependent oxidoreductase n=1 Tax=unclassified Pseudonocardia TaxID=2619320 RepID=UPI00096044CC|nr:MULTISPECIES: NAD(P)-dependent oxidoreductase [unclassified Pseudonocardia]MBN9096825.1 NAD(P)-dependent oxidoreductase [Pseudonocardia sp.]OJY49500.1 MAG: 3-hydroxyisobutyrate dehydrogenase [Pseudonocardia sp. 73-21]
MTTVALLGTGIMGAGMGRNILAAGLDLRVWNRSPEKAQPLVDAGATLAADPSDAVRGADVVVTMLGDGHHVLDVMGRAADGLAAGQVWAQTTTAGVDQSDLLALADKHGLLFVDAPVVGTRQPAESGQLVVLAAGPATAKDAVQPVFDAVGKATTWVADDAAGLPASRLKLVVNSWVLAVTAATAEAVALAKGLEVDPQAFLDSVAGGPLDLPYLQNKAKAILAGDWTPNFSVTNAAKDADLIVAAGQGAGVQLDVAAAAAARYHRAADAGHGDADMAANYLASFE